METFVTLVCGLPGTGKTTWVKRELDNALVYDLDAIAGALRYKEPHEEKHDQAVKVANELLPAFMEAARQYAPCVYIIRTAPDLAELEMIAPDRVVMCLRQYARPIGGQSYQRRLMAISDWCETRNIPIEYL